MILANQALFFDNFAGQDEQKEKKGGYVFKKFVKGFNELTESEKERINQELGVMGAETLVRQLVDAAYQMVIYSRDENREKWPKNAEKYRNLIKKVVRKASQRLSVGKNRIQ